MKLLFSHKKNSHIAQTKIFTWFRFCFNIAIPFVIVFGTLYALSLLGEFPILEYSEKDIRTTALATLITLSRLMMSYSIALLVSLPLAIFAEKSSLTKKFLLPMYDIAQSVPVLIFFPFIALLFIKLGMAEGAAIFILTIAMLWKLVFSIIFGMDSIPKEIKYTAKMYKITGLTYISNIVIPAIFPQLITGSMLAFAEGWNFIIVAESLHIYIGRNSAVNNDLFGVGALLASSAGKENVLFVYSLIAIVSMVIVLNITVWQKLLSYAEKYKF